MAPSSAKKLSKKRVAHAAGIMKLANMGPGMNVHTAMKAVGFTSPEARNPAIRKQVYQKRDQLAGYEEAVLNKAPSKPSDCYSPTPAAMKRAEEHLRLKGKINAGGMKQTARQAHNERKLNYEKKQTKAKYFMMVYVQAVEGRASEARSLKARWFRFPV